MYMFVQSCVCVRAQSVNKIDDRFPSTVRWFLHRSEIATGLWEELGDQVGQDGVGIITTLRVCFLTGGWQLTDDIAFPHPGTSKSPLPSPPLPSNLPPMQPCLRRILLRSELNRRGLSNQTTHATANAEENGGEAGVCCVTSNAPQASEVVEGELGWGFGWEYVLCSMWKSKKGSSHEVRKHLKLTS